MPDNGRLFMPHGVAFSSLTMVRGWTWRSGWRQRECGKKEGVRCGAPRRHSLPPARHKEELWKGRPASGRTDGTKGGVRTRESQTGAECQFPSPGRTGWLVSGPERLGFVNSRRGGRGEGEVRVEQAPERGGCATMKQTNKAALQHTRYVLSLGPCAWSTCDSREGGAKFALL